MSKKRKKKQISIEEIIIALEESSTMQETAKKLGVSKPNLLSRIKNIGENNHDFWSNIKT